MTRTCSVILVLTFLGGCATTNSASVAAKPAAAPVTVASSSDKASDDPSLAAAARYANEMGYLKETRRGKVVWCRSAAPIGTRFEQKECLTTDSLAQAAAVEEQNRANIRSCQGSSCTFK
ncbi:MAG TPA: hypothetical protein VHW71_09175 [Steroidobacteraceae bacterium]|jgi:hypothetical protein|nr:hypothetical protein [Steroidobacteraceae bacterium]